MKKSNITFVEIFLLIATAFVIAFVGYAIYQYATEEEAPTEQQETVAEPEETGPAPIEDSEGLDEAIEELESLDVDDELDVEEDIDDELVE